MLLAGISVAPVEPHIGHVYLVCIASVLSFAVTQAVKPFIFKTCNEKADAVIRLVAVFVGGFVGWSLSYDVLDLWLGASAGALNAFLVKVLKKKVLIVSGVIPTKPTEPTEPKEESNDE